MGVSVPVRVYVWARARVILDVSVCTSYKKTSINVEISHIFCVKYRISAFEKKIEVFSRKPPVRRRFCGAAFIQMVSDETSCGASANKLTHTHVQAHKVPIQSSRKSSINHELVEMYKKKVHNVVSYLRVAVGFDAGEPAHCSVYVSASQMAAVVAGDDVEGRSVCLLSRSPVLVGFGCFSEALQVSATHAVSPPGHR